VLTAFEYPHIRLIGDPDWSESKLLGRKRQAASGGRPRDANVQLCRSLIVVGIDHWRSAQNLKLDGQSWSDALCQFEENCGNVYFKFIIIDQF
jgi:hypothetical protein